MAGFGLIEVLIAMFVLAIGILGAGALQTVGMQTTQGGYYRTQAMFLAADAVDRMRANRASLASYNGVDSSNSYGVNSCWSSSTGCSAADLAAVDIYQWTQNFTASPPLLPSGRGTIATVGGDPHTFLITITWNENEWKNNSNSYVRDAAGAKSYAIQINLDDH